MSNFYVPGTGNLNSNSYFHLSLCLALNLSNNLLLSGSVLYTYKILPRFSHQVNLHKPEPESQKATICGGSQYASVG